jgi:hypothetical protein
MNWDFRKVQILGLLNHNFPLNSVMELLLSYRGIVMRLGVEPDLSVDAKNLANLKAVSAVIER